MTIHHSLPPALVLLATPVFADISADDVWANTTAYFAATGGDLAASVSRDGASVFVDDIALNYALPFGFGDLQITLPPMTMVEEGDGTVTQILPKTFEATVGFSSPALFIDDMQLVVSATQEDFAAKAEGTPGDITYTRSAGATGVLIDFVMNEDGLGDISIGFDFISEGYSSVTRVREGDLIEVDAESTVLQTTMSYESTEAFGILTTGTGTYGTTTNTNSFAMPVDGADITNLAPALRAGMFFDISTTTGEVSDETQTFMEGELISRDSSFTGSSESTLHLSSEGLRLSGSAQDIAVTFEDYSFIELSVAGEIAEASGRFEIPVLASAEPQDMVMSFRLDVLEMSDETWDLFDAARAIPRDAGSVEVDVSGSVTSSVDLVDFIGLEDAFGFGQMPVSINDATINALNVEGAGAAVAGSGRFTFDNNDLDTFDGLPRPEGVAAVDVTGANALLDTLVSAGLLPESEAGMGRMMLGMFTRATGDDQVSSKLEINGDGQILVNGERVR